MPGDPQPVIYCKPNTYTVNGFIKYMCVWQPFLGPFLGILDYRFILPCVSFRICYIICFYRSLGYG